MKLRFAHRSMRAMQSLCILAAAMVCFAGMPQARAQSISVAATDQDAADNAPSVESLNTVTVEAARIVTREQAVEAKKKASNIMEVQPLSEMLKLPDVNLAEALQRVPGVSLETDSGEGRFVEIRGLDPDLNATEYAGVPLPASNASSPFGGSRAVALDSFPMEVVSGVEVVETNQPDMDAESLGGTVNLLPRSGAEHAGRPFLDLDLGGGYEPLRGTPVIHVAATTGTSLNGGEGLDGLFAGPGALSAALTVVYHEDHRGIDDVEEDYSDQQSAGVPGKLLNDLQLRWYEYHRRRYGLGANLEANVDPANSLYLRLLYSGYLESANKHFLVLDGLDSATPCTPLPDCVAVPGAPAEFASPDTALEQSTTDSLERIQNSLAILGGRSILPGFALDYRVSYILGTDTVSHNYGSNWVDPNGVPVEYDNNTNANFQTYRTLDGTNPADPANYALDSIDNGTSFDRDREWGGALDLGIPLGASSTDQLKLGLAARLRHKTHVQHDPAWSPNGTISLAQYVGGAPQVYYQGAYDIGPQISLPGVQRLAADSSLTTYTIDDAADAAATTDDDENVYAGYGQYTGTFGRLGLLTGVRIEETKATYRGNLYDADQDSNTPAQAASSYTDVFPTLQLRYHFSPDLVARVAFSTAIARPGFNQITPGANVSVSNAIVTIGNPQLKPTTGRSTDLTLGYYPGGGRIAELDLFGKQFENFVLLSQQFVQGYNYPGLSGVPTVVQSFSNGPAHAYGLEAQVQQQFLSLPAPLDGLGFNANTTVVWSQAQLHPADPGDGIPAVGGPMPSTARLTWNVALFYQRDPLDVRLAADYVGQNLFGFGSIAGNAADQYSSPRLTLDLGASYKLHGSWRLYFDAKNLLNTPLKFTEGTSESQPIQREFYDATFLAGVRLSLD